MDIIIKLLVNRGVNVGAKDNPGVMALESMVTLHQRVAAFQVLAKMADSGPEYLKYFPHLYCCSKSQEH